jgi:hypothetical protein
LIVAARYSVARAPLNTEMISDSSQCNAVWLMSEFAKRTGLSPAAQNPRRYLWTDAFAVCNFLELFQQTADQQYQRDAIALIDQVHLVLGRYRDDDTRRGWISGLADKRARHHPTLGGLRIGKRLKERGQNETFDNRLEWDRDGQYFHYLTKWMHALCRAASVTGDSRYTTWAGELAQRSFEAFVRRSTSGEVAGLTWKMSTDLKRPLVPTLGLHDALDGLITFWEIEHAIQDHTDLNDLNQALEKLHPLCLNADWVTDDPLGLGGLLFDACRLAQLLRGNHQREIRLLEDILQACCRGLAALFASRYLDQPTTQRLAFRELGLAIGLGALPVIAETIKREECLRDRPDLRRTFELLLSHKPLCEEIIDLWLNHAKFNDESWDAHRDINEVMLATALMPHMFLSTSRHQNTT